MKNTINGTIQCYCGVVLGYEIEIPTINKDNSNPKNILIVNCKNCDRDYEVICDIKNKVKVKDKF